MGPTTCWKARRPGGDSWSTALFLLLAFYNNALHSQTSVFRPYGPNYQDLLILFADAKSFPNLAAWTFLHKFLQDLSNHLFRSSFKGAVKGLALRYETSVTD